MNVSRQHMRENLWLALDSLRTHKFRSLLTVLGVLIGTMTVILVASLIQGLDQQMAETAESFGTRTIWIYKLPPFTFRPTREERLRKPLTFEDAQALKAECPDVEDVSAELFNWQPPAPPFITVKYKGEEMVDAQFFGVTPNDFDLIGKTILANGHNFTVVGTLQRRKQFLGDTSNDRMVSIPYLTYKKYYPEVKDNWVNALAVPGSMDAAMDEVRAVLRRRRHGKPSEPDSFSVSTADSVVQQFRQIFAMVVAVMVVLSSIGLLVGGIGVMNIMLVSVTERTREIGVRKAIGARRG